MAEDDTKKYVKCPSAAAKLEPKTMLNFEIQHHNSSHNSFIRYKELDGNQSKIFHFNRTAENETKIVYDGKNIICTSFCLQRAQLYKRYDFNCPIPQCQDLTIDQPMPSIIEEIDFNPRDGVVPKGWRQSENPNFWSWENNKYTLNTNYYLPTEICIGIGFS